MKLSRILPFALNATTIRLAARKRIVPAASDIVIAAGFDIDDVDGFSTFYESTKYDIAIYIVYGKNFNKCAMLHDIAYGKNVFVIFIDYILIGKETKEQCNIMKNIVTVIANYSLNFIADPGKYVKDLYSINIGERLRQIAYYNIWKGLDNPVGFNANMQNIMTEFEDILDKMKIEE